MLAAAFANFACMQSDMACQPGTLPEQCTISASMLMSLPNPARSGPQACACCQRYISDGAHSWGLVRQHNPFQAKPQLGCS